jgi:predicted DCC family thiol-disulfide oxidoreductase YuxK
MNERKIYILDDNECEPCEQIKKALEKEIAEGKVQVLQITSDEALELLEKAGAPDKVEFPSALVNDEKGVRLCQIYHSNDITLSKCGDEIIAIREPVELQESHPQPEEQPQPPSP